MIQSPLNYTGGKFKLLPQILRLFPKEINTFYDLFCGGCNVGINVKASKVVFNDIDIRLHCLYGTFKNLDYQTISKYINQIIETYGLSNSDKYGYKHYNCDSSAGLGAYNKEAFLRLRKDFNAKAGEDYFYYIMLYVLIVYSFNNQIRFNSKGEFNLPAGKRDFNSKMREKLFKFINELHAIDCSFSSIDFRDFDIAKLSKNDFVYIDPPYLITCATYNENGGWNEKTEKQLLDFMDNLHKNNIKFALSNVLRSKGKENNLLIDWTKENSSKYKVVHLEHSYSNSNYQTKDKVSKSEEVLVINY